MHSIVSRQVLAAGRRIAASRVSPPRCAGRGFFRIVHRGTEAYRTALGRNPVKLLPGIAISIPIYHRTRIVDMREGFIPVHGLNAYTKDNVPVTIVGSLFYRAVDSYKVCFGVTDYIGSTTQLGTSAARAVIGQFEYDNINADRNQINQTSTKTIDDGCAAWGITCTRFEIQDFGPQNDHVKRQLELQVAAERSRRENELNTLAKIRTAEGEKTAAVLKSEGELVAARNLADAEKYRLDTETSARVRLLEETVWAFGDPTAAAEYLVEMARSEQLRAIAVGPGNTTYFLPANLLSSMDRIADGISKLPGLHENRL
jgi:regulator of protease activity HflC (stomatin/prohibitin superfamily)